MRTSSRLLAFLIAGGLGLASLALGQSIDPTFGLSAPARVPSPKPLPKDAQWIWTAETRDNQTIYLRKTFRLAKAPAHAALYITADNYFHLEVNGQPVGESRPGAEGEDVWTTVHRYDVTSLLKPGENTIHVRAENAGGQAGVVARLEADGKPLLFTDPTWEAAEAEGGPWAAAHIVASVESDPWVGRLTGWPAPLAATAPYLRHLAIKPVGVITGNEAGLRRIVYDFGKELPGRVVIRPRHKGMDGAITVGTGESEDEATQKPWKSVTADLSQTEIASPYTALRYASVVVPPSVEPADLEVEVDHLYYPVVYRGSFDCSDKRLTDIWYTGAYTAHSCMQEDIWDAPKRDRARWMGDLHVSGEVINNVFADKFLMEQTLRRLRDDAQGGRPADGVPARHVNGIPGYSCAWIAGLADFHRHIGDVAFLKSQHQNLVTLLERLRQEIGADGTFANVHGEWPFVDWSPDLEHDTPLAREATHFFLIKAVREAVFLFGELGDTANAAKYAQWADTLTAAAQAHLVADDQTFGPSRQANSMAIYSGAASPTETQAIYDHILQPGSPAWSVVATPYYNNYTIFALSQMGRTQEAVDFVRNYWGGMLREGATTWWEGYDPSWEKDHFHAHLQADNGTGFFVSLCHGWSAGPTNLLTERVLGVRPTSGGFRTCDIQPELGDLQWVEGTVPTPHGGLTARFEKRADGLAAHVVVPRGVVAAVTLPGQAPKRLTGGTYDWVAKTAR